MPLPACVRGPLRAAAFAVLAAILLLTVLGAPVAAARAPGPSEADRRAALEQVVAPPLVIHHAPGQGGLARDLADRGPGEVARLCRQLGLPAPTRIDAWILPKRGADPGLFGLPEAPDWAGGFALVDRPEIVLRVTAQQGPAGNEAATVFTHELVHCIVANALGPRRTRELPAWFGEGLATHLASEWRLVQSAHAAGLALSTSYVPLRRIEARFPADGNAAQLAYLQSFAFVEWLTQRAGDDALRQFMERYQAGASFDDAFRESFGAPWSELEDAWRTGFLLRYRWLPVLTSSATLWLVISSLFVVGGVLKRRRMQAKLREWEAEEALLWPDEHPILVPLNAVHLPGGPVPATPADGIEPAAADAAADDRAPGSDPPGRAP